MDDIKFITIQNEILKKDMIKRISKIETHSSKRKLKEKKILFNKYDFITSTTYQIKIEYGSNKLKWIEGHHELGYDGCGEIYIPGQQKKDDTIILIKFNTEEERNNAFEIIAKKISDII